jgi:hypothetical protein
MKVLDWPRIMFLTAGSNFPLPRVVHKRANVRKSSTSGSPIRLAHSRDLFATSCYSCTRWLRKSRRATCAKHHIRDGVLNEQWKLSYLWLTENNVLDSRFKFSTSSTCLQETDVRKSNTSGSPIRLAHPRDSYDSSHSHEIKSAEWSMFHDQT